MDEELRQLLAFGLGGLVGFLSSYLSQKRKNLATREDIGQITKEIEEVKACYATQLVELSHQNTMLVEQFKGQTKLRLAAIDMRLAAHQEAYALWRKLVSALHTQEVKNVVIECQEWWNRNCLYLSSEVRDAFNEGYVAAAQHKGIIQMNDRSMVDENWWKIAQVGKIIVEAVALPARSDFPHHRDDCACGEVAQTPRVSAIRIAASGAERRSNRSAVCGIGWPACGKR